MTSSCFSTIAVCVGFSWLAPVFGSPAVASQLSTNQVTTASCPQPWVCEPLPLEVDIPEWPMVLSFNLRSGFYPEDPLVPFRGNVVYYEGLADSMLNHRPLFEALSQSGFRVIAFDYQGQGGSSGSMNNTTIDQIIALGDRAYYKFARNPKPGQRIVVGWSTGGLAAWVHAIYSPDIRAIVTIAPGLVARVSVGEGFPTNQITLRSLTGQPYQGAGIDPHVDPIKPQSPLQVPSFALNLLTTGWITSRQAMRQGVKGLVLLGSDDWYVNPKKIEKVVSHKAPSFQMVTYPGGRHELDNDVPNIANAVRQEIVRFLKNLD